MFVPDAVVSNPLNFLGLDYNDVLEESSEFLHHRWQLLPEHTENIILKSLGGGINDLSEKHKKEHI